MILSEDGNIYWPIAQTVPSSGQNEKLLPFAGQKVTASGQSVPARRLDRHRDRQDRTTASGQMSCASLIRHTCGAHSWFY